MRKSAMHPANGVAHFRLGHEIHQQLLHAAHQPGPLEDRLIKLAGDGVAATMVLGDSFGEPFVAIFGGDVGPGERPHVVGVCGRLERMELVLDEMLDRAGNAAAAPFVETHVRRQRFGEKAGEIRRPCRVGFRSTLRVSKSKYSSGSTVAPGLPPVDLHQRGREGAPTDLEGNAIGLSPSTQRVSTRSRAFMVRFHSVCHQSHRSQEARFQQRLILAQCDVRLGEPFFHRQGGIADQAVGPEVGHGDFQAVARRA